LRPPRRAHDGGRVAAAPLDVKPCFILRGRPKAGAELPMTKEA